MAQNELSYMKLASIEPNKDTSLDKLSHLSLSELMLYVMNPKKMFYEESLNRDFLNQISTIFKFRRDAIAAKLQQMDNTIRSSLSPGKSYNEIQIPDRYAELKAYLDPNNRPKYFEQELIKAYKKNLQRLTKKHKPVEFDKFLTKLETIKDRHERMVTEISYYTGQMIKLQKGQKLPAAIGRLDTLKKIKNYNTSLYLVNEPDKGFSNSNLKYNYNLIGTRKRVKLSDRFAAKLMAKTANAMIEAGYKQNMKFRSEEQKINFTEEFCRKFDLPSDYLGLMLIGSDTDLIDKEFASKFKSHREFGMPKLEWIISHPEDKRLTDNINHLKRVVTVPIDLSPLGFKKTSLSNEVNDISTGKIRVQLTDYFGRLYDEFFGPHRHGVYESRDKISEALEKVPDLKPSLETLLKVLPQAA